MSGPYKHSDMLGAQSFLFTERAQAQQWKDEALGKAWRLLLNHLTAPWQRSPRA